ncbi:MAG: SufD family Fe-S cluster assembly protein, partial [Alphaproteobacteria bacterium]|nr:SufD family Fe-S cluster assembly protein [Alphaproteobacteria bacterium]
MNARPLPTQDDEAWRYSDIEAVARLWPLAAPESVLVPAGGAFERVIAPEGGVIQLDLVLGKGARAALTLLNAARDYSRIEISALLHEGADFSLIAVQIGGGEATLEIVTTLTHAEPDATSAQTVRMVTGGAATCT